jgi:tRNA(Ile2) C34 agmatinyltransferase TiaS
MLLVACPACGTRFKAPGNRAEIPCLNCDEPVPVRRRKEARAKDDTEETDDSPIPKSVFTFLTKALKASESLRK